MAISKARVGIIDMIDDECVRDAKTKQKSKKTIWIAGVSIAACVGLLCLILSSLDMNRDNVKKDNVKESEVSAEETSVLEDDVWIYYVDGDVVTSEKEFLPYVPNEIFAAWREKNGIGDEVKLIACRIDSNATTSTFEFEGKEYVRHEMGDYFILNLTVSVNMENYYEKIDSELLLQTLEQTMTGYSDIEFDEYHLIFE